MKKKNNVLYIIIGLSLVALITYGGSFFLDNNQNQDMNNVEMERPLSINQKEKGNKLPIPQLLEDKNPEEGKAEFDLNVQYGETEFFEGKKHIL